jgi:hypothetical protein
VVDKREGICGFRIDDFTHMLCCSASVGVNSCNKQHDPSRFVRTLRVVVLWVCVVGVCCGCGVGVLWVCCDAAACVHCFPIVLTWKEERSTTLPRESMV